MSYQHFLLIFLVRKSLVVSISLGNLFIIARKYDWNIVIFLEGSSLKREIGIKCIRKSLFKRRSKMVCRGYKMCGRVKMN